MILYHVFPLHISVLSINIKPQFDFENGYYCVEHEVWHDVCLCLDGMILKTMQCGILGQQKIAQIKISDYLVRCLNKPAWNCYVIKLVVCRKFWLFAWLCANFYVILGFILFSVNMVISHVVCSFDQWKYECQQFQLWCQQACCS